MSRFLMSRFLVIPNGLGAVVWDTKEHDEVSFESIEQAEKHLQEMFKIEERVAKGQLVE